MGLWTAFSLGLLGSLHCVGMCGPIALLLPYRGHRPWQSYFYIVSYQLGRIGSYALIGILPGMLGLGFLLAGYQKGLALTLGIVLLLAGLLSGRSWRSSTRRQTGLPWQNWIQQNLGQLLRSNHPLRFLGVGLLNGFLPCGLVYLALAGAVSQEGILHAMLYMACFGLGTLPMMLGASLIGKRLGHSWRPYLQRIYPLSLLLMGVLLIARGLNVELPLNLRFTLETAFPILCH